MRVKVVHNPLLDDNGSIPNRRFSEQCWTHDFEQLLVLSGNQADFARDSAVDTELLQNWDLVKAWNEATRYEQRARSEAEELYNAITDKRHGVFLWIKHCW